MNIIYYIISPVAAAALLCLVAAWAFNRKINGEIIALLSNTGEDTPAIVTMQMLDGLPAPVHLWLYRSGIVGKEAAHTVRLRQKGYMRMSAGQSRWIACKAEQYFNIDSPGYIWKVKMNMMPGVPVRGVDKFVDGKGSMLIKLWALINVVNESNEKIDESAMQRYMAEICWFPSAALSNCITWEAINDTAAKATMSYKGISCSVTYHFNGQGDVTGFSANRYKDSGKHAVREAWSIRSYAFRTIAGIRMPVQSDVTWKLKAGDFTWFRIEVMDVSYNKPSLYGE